MKQETRVRCFQDGNEVINESGLQSLLSTEGGFTAKREDGSEVELVGMNKSFTNVVCFYEKEPLSLPKSE